MPLLFQQSKEDLSIEGTGLRPLCPTWRVRTAATTAVLKTYSALLQLMQTIAETSYDDYGRRVNGLLTQLEKFDTYFGMKLSHLIFSGTKQASINLQSKNTSVQEALSCAEVTRSFLKRLRSDDSSKELYGMVTKMLSSTQKSLLFQGIGDHLGG